MSTAPLPEISGWDDADSGPSLSIRTGWRDEEWDGVLAGQTEATFFHSRRWARLIRSCFPQLTDRSLWFDGPEGPVLFPLFAWRRAGGLLTTLQSSFPFLYGGPVPSTDARGRDHLPRILRTLRPGLTSVRVSGNPFAALSAAVPVNQLGPDVRKAAEPGEPVAADSAHDTAREKRAGGHEPPAVTQETQAIGYQMHVETTHCLALPPTEAQYWEKGLTSAKRNDVRRLGKKGVVVEETRNGAEVEPVYRFYLASFKRWGGRPGVVYPLEFYQALLREGGDAIKLTVARHEGRLIGGTFSVRWNGIVHYLASYFDHESRALRPNVLIQVDSILGAIRNGFRYYDFLPSGGHSAVESFKESFGGLRTEYPVWERRGALHRILRRPPYRSGGAQASDD